MQQITFINKLLSVLPNLRNPESIFFTSQYSLFFKKRIILFIVSQYAASPCIMSFCSRTIKQHLSADIHMLAATSAFFSELKLSRDNGLQGDSKQIIEEQHNSSEQAGTWILHARLVTLWREICRGPLLLVRGSLSSMEKVYTQPWQTELTILYRNSIDQSKSTFLEG